MNYHESGGAGFIGSHLCERLVREGQTVVVLDNFFTGSSHNLANLASDPRLRLLHHDVCAPFPDVGLSVDRVVNLACPASPVHYQRDPVFTIRTALLGTMNALDLARSHGARILQASTSEVYGDPEVHPQPESYRGHVNAIGPRACYDEGKRCAETLCYDYHRMYGVKIRVARIFNTYGPRMAIDDGRVISNFVVQALRGEPLTIYGDGSQTRSFCYVDDLVDGLLALLEHESEIEPVNLGNPEEFTIRELAELVLRQTASSSPLDQRALPADDPRQRLPDISKATRLLGFKPRVTLESGLARTIEHFRERLETA
jgi:UDP-glucuronate decarboxylase